MDFEILYSKNLENLLSNDSSYLPSPMSLPNSNPDTSFLNSPISLPNSNSPVSLPNSNSPTLSTHSTDADFNNFFSSPLNNSYCLNIFPPDPTSLSIPSYHQPKPPDYYQPELQTYFQPNLPLNYYPTQDLLNTSPLYSQQLHTPLQLSFTKYAKRSQLIILDTFTLIIQDEKQDIDLLINTTWEKFENLGYSALELSAINQVVFLYRKILKCFSINSTLTETSLDSNEMHEILVNFHNNIPSNLACFQSFTDFFFGTQTLTVYNASFVYTYLLALLNLHHKIIKNQNNSLQFLPFKINSDFTGNSHDLMLLLIRAVVSVFQSTKDFKNVSSVSQNFINHQYFFDVNFNLVEDAVKFCIIDVINTCLAGELGQKFGTELKMYLELFLLTKK
ncbi:hypothetical protein HDU92_009050 [Lobulomyces angularis]|nr:hypothetical protein HDU92_009050 [Lobulomyces angularis]